MIMGRSSYLMHCSRWKRSRSSCMHSCRISSNSCFSRRWYWMRCLLLLWPSPWVFIRSCRVSKIGGRQDCSALRTLFCSMRLEVSKKTDAHLDVDFHLPQLVGQQCVLLREALGLGGSRPCMQGFLLHVNQALLQVLHLTTLPLCCLLCLSAPHLQPPERLMNVQILVLHTHEEGIDGQRGETSLLLVHKEGAFKSRGLVHSWQISLISIVPKSLPPASEPYCRSLTNALE